MILKEELGTLSGGAVDQDFYTAFFPITTGDGYGGDVTGEASGVGTSTVFETNLTAANDYYNDMTIRFTSGGNSGEKRVITDYAQTDGEITVGVAFTGAPSASDAFVIEPSVNVYSDEGTPGSWGEYLEDGTDYTISGPTGLVKILAAENQAGDTGDIVSIDYYTMAKITRGQSFTYDFDGSLSDIHELGNRLPQEIKEGPISMSGRISALYTSRRLFGLWKGESDFYSRMADYTLYLYPNGKTIGQPEFKIEGAKFGGPGSMSVEITSILSIDVSYRALNVTIGTVS